MKAVFKDSTDYSPKLKVTIDKELEARIFRAIHDWDILYFTHLQSISTNVKPLVESASLKKIVELHQELKQENAKSDGILPILVELINDYNQHELLIPYMYLSHQILEDYRDNVHLGLLGTPSEVLPALLSS